MEQLYQEIILDHYRAPHHNGLREPFGAQVHHVNPTCGDEITLRVELTGSGTEATVTDVSWDALGCSISQASTSVMTDLVIGRSLGAVLDVMGDFTTMVTSRGTVQGDEDVLGDGIAFAGVAKYPARVKCALLGWMAFKDAAAQITDAQITDGQITDGQITAGPSDGSTTALRSNEPAHQTEGASR